MNNRIHQDKDKIQKDKEQADKSQEANLNRNKAKTFCKICFKRTSPLPKLCKCTSKQGGGTESGSKEETQGEEISSPNDQSSLAHAEPTTSTNAVEIQAINSNDHTSLDKIPFDSNIISELLIEKILLINNDRDSGILTFKCNPDLIANKHNREQIEIELQKYVDAILDQLKNFKEHHGIVADCYTLIKDARGNLILLTITLPTPGMYDAFISKLGEKHLLPIQNINQEPGKNVQYPKNENLFTPLSTSLTPYNNKKRQDEEQNQGHNTRTPLKTILTLDDLK